MAKKRKKSRTFSAMGGHHRVGRGPTSGAKKKYYGLVVKAYNRLHNVLRVHNPSALK